MRLAFLGTPEAAVPTLRGLVDAGHEVALVVSRVDKRRGRGSALVPSPVKAAALELHLPVTTSPDDVVTAGVDLGVVVAYGRIIKPPLLGAVPLVNIHFSLLPRWRGAAPVERAVLAGDAVTGVCLMELEAGLDTGPVYRRAETPVDPDETAEQLRSRLALIGRDLLVEALADGLGPAVPQEGEPVYAAKIDPAELQIDWGRPAIELLRLIRLERAWTTFGGRRLIVLAAGPGKVPGGTAPGTLLGEVVATGAGGIRLVTVKPENKVAIDAAAWLRGARGAAGAVLGR